jgi:hypothetical protein
MDIFNSILIQRIGAKQKGLMALEKSDEEYEKYNEDKKKLEREQSLKENRSGY